MAERGEFTRKFDRQILQDKTAEEEERAVQRQRVEAEDAALEAEFHKVLNILEYRASWLKERFRGFHESGDLGRDVRGRHFDFADGGGKKIGWLEFRTRLTDSHQAILVESYMQLEGRFPRRYDYITVPKERVPIERVKKFVESKIYEFAGPYQELCGP